METKTIVFLMMGTMAVLFGLSRFFRMHEQKIANFERFFFEKLSQENGSIDKIKNEVIEYGKKLGLNDKKIQSLIQENQF